MSRNGAKACAMATLPTDILFWWLALLSTRLCGASAQAEWHEGTAIKDGAQGRPLRLLHATPTGGNITIPEAQDALRAYGIDDFGRLLYFTSSPTCPVTNLTAGAASAVGTFCAVHSHIKACLRRGKGAELPAWRLECLNGTCEGVLAASTTSCVFKNALEVPIAQTVNRSCVFDIPSTEDSSVPFVPVHLQDVDSRPIFDCLTGAPPGSTILANLVCDRGFFRVRTEWRLGGGSLAPPATPFRCVFDGECGEEGCCGNAANWEGRFICYLPESRGAGLLRSAAGRAGGLGRLLAACQLFSLLLMLLM